MISCDIKKDNITHATILIDSEQDDFGFVIYQDESELKTILNYVVDIGYLNATTINTISSVYFEMDEKITFKDNRFLSVLKTQLNQYDFTKPIKHDISIQDFLEEKRSET